eukprot:gnl/MRDRNA2_/MRDRNA2_107369_c0_seq1.p1 gnl/MRDRNA2_/MRDRNA2_107369_c0~~gnl/MRDRNA2_/MRDRNA2_107369_c0_seq1.p1  ORF type:complete len:166 (+),score=32.55 gnl/MRDRNA2_/MRDRNA2_107369_c0_seq1:95-592(+)
MSLAIRTTPMFYIALVLFSAHSSCAVRLPSTSSAMSKADPLKQKQQLNHGRPDYGLLGNVIAQFADSVFGPSKAASAPPAQNSEKAKTVTPIVHSDAKKVSFVSPLKGIKELLRLLWSNFLPDPTFDHAIEDLKKRDEHFSIDNEGVGTYITAAEKAKLLSHAAM